MLFVQISTLTLSCPKFPQHRLHRDLVREVKAW